VARRPPAASRFVGRARPKIALPPGPALVAACGFEEGGLGGGRPSVSKRGDDLVARRG
jgi:hypothetical protein